MLLCVYMCVSWCTKWQSEDSLYELLSFYYVGPRDGTLDASKYLEKTEPPSRPWLGFQLLGTVEVEQQV